MGAVMDTLRAERDARSRTQDRINTLRLKGEIRDAIRSAAYERNAKYPQYAGHWDGEEWRLGFVKRSIRTKMGVAFRFGDAVLYRTYTAQERAAFGDDGGAEYVTAYSVRNEIDTSVAAADIEELAFTTRYRHPDGLVWLEGA